MNPQPPSLSAPVAKTEQPPASQRMTVALPALVLCLLATWGAAPLVFLVVKAQGAGASVSAGPGVFIADQLQYLSWIRSASDHFFAASGFDLRPGGHVFVHPMFTLSGLAVRAGLSLPLSLVLWTPIAAGTLFYGCLAYIRHTVDSRRGRGAALMLAIFFVSPVTPFLTWIANPGRIAELSGELSPADELWGYAPIVLTIGLMPLFLLGLERMLGSSEGETAHGRTWYVGATSLTGLLVSWLHPWQGETLLLIVAGLVVWSRLWRRWKELVLPVFATITPLLYYFALSKLDGAWRLAQAQTPLSRPSVWVLLLATAPLAILAVLGRPRGALVARERLLLLWPIASLSVYLVFASSYPPHALEGLSLPLAVLAVRGWGRLGLPSVLALIAVVALTVPSLLPTADFYRRAVDAGNQPYLLRPAEQRALAFIDRAPDSGGVLPSPTIAAVVPAYTGHRSWRGHGIWTPGDKRRAGIASDLFAGRVRTAQAGPLLQQIGARYILADCNVAGDLTATLGGLLLRRHGFGCATVYELRLMGGPGKL